MRLRNWILPLTLAWAAPPALGFIVDGKFDGAAEGYSLGFSLSFNLEGGASVSGGQLFFGTDTSPGGTGDYFLYFAMPTDYATNIYSSDKGVGGRDFKSFVNSDSLGTAGKRANLTKRKPAKPAQPFLLNPVNSSGQQLQLAVDYLATDDKKNPTFYRSGGIATVEVGSDQDNTDLRKNEGKVIAGDADGVKQIATSLEYNIANFATAAEIRNGTGVIANSPHATNSDWLQEYAYELRFDSTMFDTAWTNADTALSFLDLGGAHVSPRGKKFTIDFKCISSCGGSGQPPPLSVPEPGSLSLAALGLVALGLRRRRRRRGEPNRPPKSP